MMTLADIKTRHAHRKITHAAMTKLLGPDQSDQDFDAALAMIDEQKELFREVLCWLRNNPKQNDEVWEELLNKVGRAGE